MSTLDIPLSVAKESLAHAEEGELHHQGKTIQDVMDSLSPTQRDAQALVIAAALQGEDLSGNPDLVDDYLELPDDAKVIADFIVGHVLTEPESFMHADELSNYLAHYGVKGMRWGVRKDDSSGVPRLSKTTANSRENRREAREKVKKGVATLEEAHVAGLKSTGHRVANAFLGDKTYWKNYAKVAGVSVGVVGAGVAAAWTLPASVLTAIGTSALASTLGQGAIAGTSYTAAHAGGATLAALGLSVASVTSSVGVAGAQVTNFARAVRGNARINRSHASLGEKMMANQRSGNTAVRKTLNKSGSLRKKDLKHDDIYDENYLAHYGVKGMKWGVRRSDAELSGGSEKKSVASRIKNRVTKGKKSGGDSDDAEAETSKKPTELSADADRFIRTRLKEQHEMSDREIQEAINRVQRIDQYNKLMPGSANAELQAKVDSLKLQKQYKELSAELTPEKSGPLKALVSKAESGYEAFKKVDEVVGGKLSDALKEQVSKKLGVDVEPEDAATAARKANEMLNLNLENLKARRSILQATRALENESPKPPDTRLNDLMASMRANTNQTLTQAQRSSQNSAALRNAVDQLLGESGDGSTQLDLFED